MEPKPVVTIHGELELIGPVLQRTLQSKLKSLQKEGYSKDEKAFSSLCNGIKFVEFQSLLKSPTPLDYFVHNSPCVHTYWTDCSTLNMYEKMTKLSIENWISKVNKLQRGSKTMMIVYCVTPEVRSRRPRLHMPGRLEQVEGKIIGDFRRDNCSVINLRLASADEQRKAESYSLFVQELNRVCLSEFLRNVSNEEDRMKTTRRATVQPDAMYQYLCEKLSLAIASEMIRSPHSALRYYSTVNSDLEASITIQVQGPELPPWLSAVREAPIENWDYPSLLYPQQSWKYLAPILENKAHLLHIWSLLFARSIHILCGTASINQKMPACLQVSQCCIDTLHSIARSINILKVPLPGGVFNSWSYMTCMECVNSIMLNIDPEVLANTSSAILILIRAELWHYAWEKLRSIGLLCNLMPGVEMSEQHHKIVETICKGITVPFDDGDGDENLGKMIRDILQSKEKFKTQFMHLGDMVIGAFKMAGRRRMAFSIGTMMAEFHKEVGLVKEAERLLCDVTSLHSVGQWPQLSSSAYSILAHCQKKLKQEDKEVNSLIVLVTTPKYANSTHDPLKYMDQLIHIADYSKYQKLLSWEPLFVLDNIVPEQYQYNIGDSITLTFRFHYYGPKAMKLTRTSFILESEYQLSSTPNRAGKSTDYTDSLDYLEEIQLDPGPMEEKLLESRRIGGDKGSKVHKVYYSSTDDSDEVVFTPGLELASSSTVIEPGTNTITVNGKINSPGTYYPYHIILKNGALDFCAVVPFQKAKSCPLLILQEKVAITVSLVPQTKVILTGVTVACLLEISTGAETSIKEKSEILIKSPPNVALEAIKDATIQNLHSLGIQLPEVSPLEKVRVPFDLTPNSAYDKEYPDIPEVDFSQGNTLFAWQHEIEVCCEWLTPPHVAKLPVTAYEPFAFSHVESSAGGDNTFLQLTVVNSSPIPLVLLDHRIKTSLELFSLTGEKPDVFYPGDSFSFLWQHRKGSSSKSQGCQAVFCIDYIPKEKDSLEQPSRTVRYKFKLSNMETVYSLKCSAVLLANPSSSQPIRVNQTVIITYTVTNITQDFRDSIYFQEELQYKISADPAYWELHDCMNMHESGTVQAPRIAQHAQFKIAATPKQSGLVLVPSCSLILKSLTGASDDSSSRRKMVKEVLTGARCYNTCDWHRVDVL